MPKAVCVGNVVVVVQVVATFSTISGKSDTGGNGKGQFSAGFAVGDVKVREGEEGLSTLNPYNHSNRQFSKYKAGTGYHLEEHLVTLFEVWY